MQILFRTDASRQIGTGHVMRCLTLADALQTGGAQCHFICREHSGNLIAQIRQRGFAVSALPNSLKELEPNDPTNCDQSNYSTWLGVDWATDAAQTKVSVGGSVIDWLIVDHYALDARWERALRPVCRKLMAIDDLADRPHECDLLLDQNLGRDARDYSQFVSDVCTVLAGPYYALLRPEFAFLRGRSLRRRVIPQLKNVLITMGGVDQGNATGKVLEVLQTCALPEDLCITIVMGSHAPWLESVQLLAKKMARPTTVKVNVINMADLMADSDLAIGAAGSTSWERCCLGLPAIIVVQADNQQLIANALELIGAAKVSSVFGGTKLLHEQISKVLSDISGLQRMSVSASKVTDGCGADRVAARLREMELV
jgi:UDP-2,4-diacetamido-2,4,6-trideoxy-beta-L-altropyranose hydrolase